MSQTYPCYKNDTQNIAQKLCAMQKSIGNIGLALLLKVPSNFSWNHFQIYINKNHRLIEILH